jgi:hypothetical protein
MEQSIEWYEEPNLHCDGDGAADGRGWGADSRIEACCGW